MKTDVGGSYRGGVKEVSGGGLMTHPLMSALFFCVVPTQQVTPTVTPVLLKLSHTHPQTGAELHNFNRNSRGKFTRY